jgi:hypothetical protein
MNGIPTAGSTTGWTNWPVIDTSGFEVDSPDGRVAMAQTSTKQFEVGTSFRFAHHGMLGRYRKRLIRLGNSTDEADHKLDQARQANAGVVTDLASVPMFLAWFEAPYGRHTLAAILHDELIVAEPNGGYLGSDTMADSFFRDMMGIAGVPFFKRWLMWTAVAARSRWAVGGWRRLSLILWSLIAVAGTALAYIGWGRMILNGDVTASSVALAVAAFVLPIGAGFFWGRQYGAGIVAAAAGIWIVPAAVIVLIGLGVYRLSEWIASVLITIRKAMRGGGRVRQRSNGRRRLRHRATT